jgi:ferritin-like metal-binding protein YciE
MKLLSANIEGLQGLYIGDLKKALDMELKISRALPYLAENCSDQGLGAALRKHHQETKAHIYKVEALLRRLIGEASTEPCRVTQGLATEALNIVRDVDDLCVRDIALVGVVRRMEHLEMAVYGTLRDWAEWMGMDQDARMLESIRREEAAADELLQGLSQRADLGAAA